MNLNAPTYAATSPYNIADPNNALAASYVIPMFLCPSDKSTSLGGAYGVASLGPSNYCANQGSGTNVLTGGTINGSPYNADGVMFANSKIRIADITDGTSNTACMSESVLGDGARNATGTTPPASPQKVYAYNTSYSNVDDASCAAATSWNVQTPRQFLWYSGEIRNTSYNHYYNPNDYRWDCITNAYSLGYTAVGWKAARSMHLGGVHLLMCDGSVRFVSNNIDTTLWRSLATRAGGEVISNF